VLATYRRALGVPGALRFSLAGVLARLPIAMMGIGILLLVTEHTGSYATAGRLTAVYVVGNAVGALPLARLVDSLGQRTVLLPAALVSATALALMVVAVTEDWSPVLAYAACVVAGATFPNVGSAVRARWAHAVRGDRDTLETAFAWEAVLDETVFILGPTLVTVLAAALDPVAALVLAVTALLTGTAWLVSQRASEPPVHADSPDGERAAREPMPWAGLLPLVAAAFLLGAMFGGCEVATIALADEQDRPAMAGAVLALWALGSLVAGLVTGALDFRRGAAARFRGGLVALATLMAPTPFIGDLAGMGLLLLFAGLAIAPTLIAAVSWVESIVPPKRLNEGLAAFHTALVVGIAPGAAVTGLLVDRAGASTSYWVAAGAALLGAAVGGLSLLGPGPGTIAAEKFKGPGPDVGDNVPAGSSVSPPGGHR
jgi:predicted MFS family arabinose efflux permease